MGEVSLRIDVCVPAVIWNHSMMMRMRVTRVECMSRCETNVSTLVIPCENLKSGSPMPIRDIGA